MPRKCCVPESSKKDEQRWSFKSTQSITKRQGDDVEWKNRRATPLSELHSLARRATNATTASVSQEGSFDEGHTRVMASLMPDEIIYNVADYSKRAFEGCLLFGDVSGFTDLCEKYNKSGKGGPSRLTQVLNAYIGAMVQEILSHSGDVLKFSGDAFIAMWKETDHLSLRDAVHEAIDCALVIQKTYGTYQTDVEVVVRVKLAVACGHLTFSLVGDSENSHYLMIGQPIMDIKAAESLSSAGEIVISTKVSHHLSANEYLIDMLPDRLHAKVLGVGPNWRNIQRHYEKEDIERYSILSASPSMQDNIGELTQVSSSNENLDYIEDDNRIASRVVNDQYALRPAVNYAARFKLKDELRRFIIGPVMRGIDAEEPLEYLTEIRQVCIVFINCKVSSAITPQLGIDVANDVYVTVCNVVKNRYGCVNKISNFDKDLMLLVIFGLRGFKHELESQIALKCAIECRDKIKVMQHVFEIATGVTTGKCYCGAFGHTLRREYTVIGLVVNKAARLMVAYPNKVTCDRETFLHSKLESKNFFLQEYKFLKGIANPGPIYEFKGVEKNVDAELSLTINPLPILGREQELDLYLTLVSKAMRLSSMETKEHFQNMLILQGGNRQGKSRLLEEIIYITDPDVPLNRMSLSAFDYEVPYRAVRRMLQKFIDCSSDKSDKEKQRVIRSRLQNRPSLEPYLCFLNRVFNVNFPKSDHYNDMDKSMRYETLQYIFRILCHDIFVRFWVLVIDDSENVDDDSWFLIDSLLDQNLVFIVATMGSEKSLSTLALEILKKDRVKCVELKKIDKWYHVGLACQMLDVDGIPPELEKTIQIKSSGNPGWVESFLVSLMQSGGLYIHEMTRKTAYETGIVIAPLYMTMRLSKEEMQLWVQIMEERKISVTEDKMTTRWKMFIDSCRESYPDLSVSKKFAEKMSGKEIVNICTVYQDFNLEDVDPETAIDVIILKTFDALTSYEQLLLKCSAILGDIFPRDMLLYIMSSSAIRFTALAVQKLFEIHVLSCAKGNFIEGGLSFKERLVNPNEDMSIRCDCKGLIIDESCTDLPKYASCGFLRFRSSEFRETTYNLLTDNQKREFHERAIRYMEKETRRCRACGNGYFVRQMGGGKIDYNLRFSRTRAKNRSMVTESSSINETYGTAKLLQRASFISSESFQSTKSKDFSKQRENFSIFSTSSSLPTDTSSLHGSHQVLSSGQQLGLITIHKLKDNFNLIRTFSSTDYTQCTCLLVLNTMYAQLIEHCKGAGLVEKIMNATVEYSYVCIDSKNIPQAVKVLEEALILLEGPMKEQIELEWMVELKRGKLLALLGLAHMEMNDDQCLEYYLNALKCYGVKFPKSALLKSLNKYRLRFKNILRYLSTNIRSKRIDDDVAEYCNNVSECLSFLCKYYIKKRKWNEAELAALWSLSKAVESETDFEKLCIAYANLIFVSYNIGFHNRCIALEVFALRTCHKKVTYVELEELKAISFLYFTISRSRLRRAETEKFLHIGYVVWRVSTSSQTELQVYRMLPLLSYIVLLRKQILEFSNMLQEIQYLLEHDTDNSQRSWYHALCLVCHLETGLQAEPYSKCSKFLQGHGMEPTIRDPDGRKRLVICTWLWEVRNENWEAAFGWQKAVWTFEIAEVGESIQNLFTGLYLLEGLIIYLVFKLDNKNLKEIAKADAKILEIFRLLHNATKYCKIINPRLYHMKAYYRVSKFNDFKGALKILKTGRKYADLYMNEMEMTYMRHSEMAWCRKLPREDADFWRDHCDEDNLIDVHDVDFVEKFAPYTLPIPLYV